MPNIQETPKTFKDVKVGENFLMSDGKYTKQSSRTAVSWRSGGKIYLSSSQPIRQVKHSWGWGV
jgi:hypothetical protein